eukprot:gene9903-10916_t
MEDFKARMTVIDHLISECKEDIDNAQRELQYAKNNLLTVIVHRNAILRQEIVEDAITEEGLPELADIDAQHQPTTNPPRQPQYKQISKKTPRPYPYGNPKKRKSKKN